MNKGTAHIFAVTNPVSRERHYCPVEAGRRLSDHLVTPEGCIVTRNGKKYLDGLLASGDVINIVVPPQGSGEGKNIARQTALLAVQVGAAALTSGWSLIGQAAFVGAVSIGAGYGLQKLIPPPDPTGKKEAEFNRLGVLTGSRNRINPYGIVPRVYGHRRVFPVMSGRPFTEIEGNRQYQYLLFNLGYGPLELSNPMIGETPIGSFGSDNVFTSNGVYEDIEIDVAESPSLYTSQVFQSNPSVALNEIDEEDPPAQAQRTTSDNADQISIDLIFPQGLFSVKDNGKTSRASVLFTIEYREVGAGSWTTLSYGDHKSQTGFGNVFTPTLPSSWLVASSKRETHFASVTWGVTKGQYEVRITRGESVFEEENRFTDCNWLSLKTTTFETPTDLPGTVQLAMRIKATDQLSGVLDNFSVEAKSRLAVHDGNNWDVPTFDPNTGNGTGGLITSNPAWIIADILAGSATAKPIDRSRIDADEFKGFADNCDSEERECNLVIDSQQTILQTISLVGSTGRGSITMRDNGIYSVIQDTEQSVPVQHFTPRNSWDFSSTRVFPDLPHALRVNFVNPDEDWQTDEATVYADGYNEDGSGGLTQATKFETIDLEGVTSWDQAWKEGRYRLAEAILRPERYSISVDVENLVCTRGDLVRVTHDVTLHGIGSGRIKSINGNDVTIDDAVIMEAGKNYSIRIRATDSSSLVKTVTTNAGSQTTLTLSDTTGITAGDLFMFGETGSESQEMKVLSIEPMNDLTARLTLVDAAPDIYDADTGTIPNFDSNVTRPPIDIDRLTPPNPTIIGIRSEGASLVPGSDGSPQLRIVTSYVIGSGNPTSFVEGRYRKPDDDAWTGFGVSEASAGTLSIYDVEKGETYIIQIRARSGERASAWVQASPHIAGANLVVPGRPEGAIGKITGDLDGVYTQIPVEIFEPVYVGRDYILIDESFPREVIPLEPTGTAGTFYDTGAATLFITETAIQAPSGSYIYREPDAEIRPGFDFVGATLKIVDQELQAALDVIDGVLDDIADGVNFAKVNASAVQSGDIVLSTTIGDIDDIDDGTTYAKVLSTSISAGNILLVETIGDLDDVSDGTSFAKVALSQLTPAGLVVLSVAVGDLDDIDDGTSYAKVLSTKISAGSILLSEATGDLDDLANGTNFGKVAITAISAGNILLAETVGDVDDIDDGTTYGKVLLTSLSAGKIVLAEVTGDIDDIADGTTYAKVKATVVDVNGVVVLSAVSGDLDDIDDGTSFAKTNANAIDVSGFPLLDQAVGDLDDVSDGTSFKKVAAAQLTAAGLVILSATIGDLDDIDDGTYAKVLATNVSAGHIKITGPDGQTVIDQGTIDTLKLVVGDTVFIGNNLSTYESGNDRILIGNSGDESVPYVRAQRDANNYVQMVGRSGASTAAFFKVQAGGITVMEVKSTGATIGGFDIGSNFLGVTAIDEDGVLISQATQSIQFTDMTQLRRIFIDDGSLRFGTINGSGSALDAVTFLLENASGTAYVTVSGLESSDPGGTNRLWNNGGFLAIT